METGTIPIVRRHIDQLKDTDLDRMIDRGIFHHPEYCYGRMGYQYHFSNRPIYRCPDCQAVEEWTLAQVTFGSDRHFRAIPRYTASTTTMMPVVDLLRRATDQVREGYIKALQAQCPMERSLVEWLSLDVQPRQLALAALQAVGVIDSQGYLAGGIR